MSTEAIILGSLIVAFILGGFLLSLALGARPASEDAGPDETGNRTTSGEPSSRERSRSDE